MLDQNVVLMEALGYTFKDLTLLRTALTHRSYSAKHNERMEFLGDSVLSLCIAEKLYHDFPYAREGQLSRMRSNLVKGETLARLGKELNLGNHLILGPGELKTGGHRRASILEDAVEAIIGAIYLDSDLDTCKALLLKWFDSRLEKLDLKDNSRDNKSRLQEWLQGRSHPLPEYELIKTEGEDHDQTFFVTCRSAELDLSADGVGKSRKAAEQAAAVALLELCQSIP